jgi:hypothetical protein
VHTFVGVDDQQGDFVRGIAGYCRHFISPIQSYGIAGFHSYREFQASVSSKVEQQHLGGALDGLEL